MAGGGYKRALGAIAAALLLASALVGVAIAAGPVAPDQDFGEGGFVRIPAEDGDVGGSSVVVDEQGRVVATGYAPGEFSTEPILVRVLPDGTLDPSFGDG